jgi:hypothetical protein
MTFRIERTSVEGRVALRVSGRLGMEHLVELKSEVEGLGAGTVLDLEHVTLVDVDAVRFLSECEACGMDIVHCSPYIREWIIRERHR